MSTKAYSGFRMKQRTFPAVLEALQKSLSVLTAHSEERKARFLARRAAELIDHFHVGIQRGMKVKNLSHGALVEARQEMMERQRAIRADMRRDPEVDFDIKLTLWYSKKTNAYIGHIDAESSKALDLFLHTGVAGEFGYWNNTDRPDNLNERQWKKRADVWREITRPDALPACAVSVPEPGFVRSTDAAQYVPTFDERVASVARDLALHEWVRESLTNGVEKLEMSRISRFLRRTNLEGTDEHRLFREACKLVQSLLPREITKDMLSERFVAPLAPTQEAEGAPDPDPRQ